MLTLLIEIMFCAIDALTAMWFISEFLQKHTSLYKHIDFWIFTAIHFSVNTISLFITLFSTLVSLFNVLIMMLYSLQCKSPYRTIRKVVAPIVFEGILALGNVFIFIIPTSILKIETSLLTSNKGVVYFIFGIMSKMLLLTLLTLVLRLFQGMVRFKIEDYFLLIVFPLMIMIELSILVKISLTYGIKDYYNYFSAAVILMILSNVCVYYLIYKIAKNNRIQSEKELYQQLLHYEERRYTDMGEGLKQIKKIRHDIKNQLLMVSSRLDNDDVTGAKEMLSKITDNVNSAGNIIQCGNKVADYIINTKLGTLNDTMIIVSGNIYDGLGISDLDFSIILGNILDNAIEAIHSIKNSKIELVFFNKDNYQNIVVKNSISHSIMEHNEELKTTKEDSEHHGFGIKSIKEVVARYNGDVELFEQDNMFCVHVIVPIA